MAHGEYSHIEIPFDDEERVKRFYSGVFGWEFSQMPGFEGDDLYRAGPGDLGGGLGKRGEMAGATVRNYITIDSVDAAVAKGNRARRDDHPAQGRAPGHGLVRGRHR